MGQRRACQRIGVGADIGLAQQITDGVIREGLHRRDALAHRRRGDAIEGVIGKGLGKGLVGVGAGEHVAERVIRIGEVLNDIAGAGEDRRETPGGGIEALVCDDAVTGGLLGQVQLGIQRVRGPVDLPARADNLLSIAEARVV